MFEAAPELRVSVAGFTDKGPKKVNQDFHGARQPSPNMLTMKGITLVMADGISSSPVSQIASETAVKTFLEDYYCTSEAWSVKTSVEKVLSAINSWLFAQSQQGPGRYNKDQGYVCTLSALVVKHHLAHVFHVGDTRVYSLSNKGLTQVTHDHKLWVSESENYLNRAMGMHPKCELDYQAVPLEVGQFFILCTDGVYNFVQEADFIRILNNHKEDLQQAAQALIAHALAAGSNDNLSVQLLRVDEVPKAASQQIKQQAEALPLPPPLQPHRSFDGYQVLRQIHNSNRSHIYLVQDMQSHKKLVLKTPSLELSKDPESLEHFLREEWIARRVNSAHVLKADLAQRQPNFLYTLFEHIEGQTLAQWAIDHPKPSLEKVRDIIEQVAKGLNSLHKMEMLHQDIRPENIMIDQNGTVKIIDFGSVYVAGLAESSPEQGYNHLKGSALYSAPEYFLGDAGSVKSELFSLGILTYFLLSGRYPYSTQVAQAKTLSKQRSLYYHPVRDEDSEIPVWVDYAIQQAVHPLPESRHSDVFEFMHNLRHPSHAFLRETRPPLIERNPVLIWQVISAFFALLAFYFYLT